MRLKIKATIEWLEQKVKTLETDRKKCLALLKRVEFNLQIAKEQLEKVNKVRKENAERLRRVRRIKWW